MRLIVFLFFFLLSGSAWAQSYVQQAFFDGNAPLKGQFANPDAAGNTIWVGSSGSNYVACSSTVPTDTEGNTFVLLATIVGTGSLNQANQCAFAAFNIKGGTKDAVTCYGTNNTFAISCNTVELQGVNAFDSATCVSNSCITDGNSSGIISSPAINTNFANEILIGFAAKSLGGQCGSVFAGPGAGYTQLTSGSIFYEYRVISTLQAGATATVDKGSTACEWSLGIYAFYQASATTSSGHISSISLSPAAVVGGVSSTGTVTLNGAAPNGGAVVTLSSSNTSAATVPASVIVPAGATSTTFPVATTAVSTPTAVTISGTYNGTMSAPLMVNPPGSGSPTVNFSSGFGGQTTLTLNGGAAINGSRLRLTDGGTYEGRSAFYSTPVNVQTFTNNFSFQLTSPIADGFTFTIQRVGANALGPAGGGLGYGPDSPGGTLGIPASVAVKFDLYSNAGEGGDSTGVYTNGASPTTPALDMTGSGVDLHSGDVMNVQMSYDGTTLIWTITDTTTGKNFKFSWGVNIPSVVGGNTAYIGFTAGTGGLTAIQEILSWSYSAGSQ